MRAGSRPPERAWSRKRDSVTGMDITDGLNPRLTPLMDRFLSLPLAPETFRKSRFEPYLRIRQ